jgi:hypothetical protein
MPNVPKVGLYLWIELDGDGEDEWRTKHFDANERLVE